MYNIHEINFVLNCGDSHIIQEEEKNDILKKTHQMFIVGCVWKYSKLLKVYTDAEIFEGFSRVGFVPHSV